MQFKAIERWSLEEIFERLRWNQEILSAYLPFSIARIPRLSAWSLGLPAHPPSNKIRAE